MKIRNGFVSNSSSSSFLCDTCGEQFCGYDMCPSETNHTECDRGHVFCDDKQLELPDGALQLLKDDLIAHAKDYYMSEESIEEVKAAEDIDDLMEFYDDGIPSLMCPCCQLKAITLQDRFNYALMILDKTNAELEEEIRSHYANTDVLGEAYLAWIKGKEQ